MRQVIVYLLAVLLLYAPKASADPYLIQGSDFQDSGWFGMAFANSESGGFNHCAVSTTYDNGQMLTFSITPWPSFSIYFPVYQGASGVASQFPINIWIDDLEPIRGLARMVDDHTAFLGLPLEQDMVEVFQAGWLMTIEIENGWRQTYKLRGTRNAINGLRLCAANYWNYSETNPPELTPKERSERDKFSSSTQVPDKGSKPDTPPTTEITKSTGTGFYVNSKGFVLTNAHVVNGCRTVTVDGVQANIAATSEVFDLAVLRVESTSSRSHAVFAKYPAEINSAITVSGYPYSGLLGGINVTRGTVTSLKGFGGDDTKLQISAPIQPGNSGGPVVNDKGEVLGVVVSTLNAGKFYETVGDIPQNINFAIYGHIAQLFLMQNRVPFDIGNEASDELSNEGIGRVALSFTAFIECHP